jgi:hypothetical protein
LKVLNVPRDTSEYQNLVKLDSKTKSLKVNSKFAQRVNQQRESGQGRENVFSDAENEDPEKGSVLASSAVPGGRITKVRAKKSVSQSWLESRELKPNLDKL